MSMLSSQIDHLRELADALDGRYGYQGYEIAMRDAADTILELRDDLQRANAENAKLREELEAVGTAAYLYGRDDLKAENAKLRELVADMWNEGMCECGSRGKCARCEYGYPDRMRELGIEVG